MNKLVHIASFEQMLECALAEDSVKKARPMTDAEIQWLIAYIRTKQANRRAEARYESQTSATQSKTVVYKDLEQTLFSMVELIRQEKNAKQAVYARKLLRRIGEIAINVNSIVPNIIH